MAILQLLVRRVFITLNIITVLLFLLACANAFLHPERWWLIALLGLIFPLLLLLLVCFVLAGIFLPGWRRWSLVSFLALIIGWSNIHSFLALHPLSGFNTTKAPNSIRILTWNVRSFDEWITKKKGASGHREKMLDFIAGQHPDVVCFQEFLHSHQPADSCNIPYYQQRLHLPYYMFSHDYTWSNSHNEKYESGVAILSRYPIVDSMAMNYTRSSAFHATESLISADLLVGKDTVRVFTTHLQSVLFHEKDFHDLEIIRNVDDSILSASRSIAKKLGYAFRHRADQAQEVRAILDKSAYPGVICGDFNDVPNSYTYFTIRKDWQDAFLQKGFGIGRTYVHISPTLRIDYILADRRFSVLQCRKYSLPWSDHNPVVADLRLSATAPQ
jgi:endonuclease/exonuclease/phosphatase family metal-dependent hydrolase